MGVPICHTGATSLEDAAILSCSFVTARGTLVGAARWRT